MERLRVLSALGCAVASDLMAKVIGAARRRSPGRGVTRCVVSMSAL